jgi:photosystem II stability/assembly factor-like uncharacterized protein
MLGTIVGDSGLMLRTSDAGSTWIRRPSGTIARLNTVYFVNENIGYAGGLGVGLKTTDGGAIWDWIHQSYSTAYYGGVHFADSFRGIAVGTPTLGAPVMRWTTNGGQLWSTSSSTLSTFRPCGVAMLGASKAVAVGNAILRSTDGGATWIEPISILQFYGVSFADSNVGTAVGNHVYRTTDGGMSWTEQYDTLTPRLYAVDQITPTVAVAVGDSGAIYRTMTGGLYTDVEPAESFIPAVHLLEQNYPNPFNPVTTIRFTLPQQGFVTLKVYDILGEEVITLLSGEFLAGQHSVRWDASNKPSGVYFYRLESGSFVQTKKLVLLR